MSEKADHLRQMLDAEPMDERCAEIDAKAKEIVEHRITRLARYLCREVGGRNPDSMIWWTGEKDNPTSARYEWEMYITNAAAILRGDF